MYTGAIPTVSIYGTWSENVEVWSVDDDTLMDLSSVTEITLKLRSMQPRPQTTAFDELTLTMSNGDIVIPSTGIIQWRVEATAMGALEPKTYEVILLIEDDLDTVPLILGSVTVVE